MPAQTVTLRLPGSLYDHFEARAKRSRRSVETEILRAVEAAGVETEEWPRSLLPQSLEEAVQDLSELDDAALWQVARDHLPADAAREMEALNHKQQREGLSPAEDEKLDRLTRAYERFLLLRAEAVGLLQERGHDVSVLASVG